MKKRWVLTMLTLAMAAGMGALAWGQEETVSNDLFSVAVPEEIAQISDVTADSESISFYEKISHGKYGGFVGSIELYESVREYGDIPNYRRAGIIRKDDGSKLDVVLVYPSDVQFDMEDQDSIDHYGQIQDAFREQVVPSLEAVDGTYIPQEEVDTTGIYMEILDQMAADLREGKEPAGFEEDGFSYVYGLPVGSEKEPSAVFGYAFADLNGDGYDEMMIGSIEDGTIYDLYTQLDTEVIHAFCGGERDRLTLVGHKNDSWREIREEASGGASNTVINFFNLEPTKGELFRVVSFVYDSQADPENPFGVSYSWEDEVETISEEDWNTRQGNFGETVMPDYHAFETMSK